MAAAQVKKAAGLIKKFTKSQEQDIARVTFSDYARGHASAATRKVPLDSTGVVPKEFLVLQSS